MTEQNSSYFSKEQNLLLHNLRSKSPQFDPLNARALMDPRRQLYYQNETTNKSLQNQPNEALEIKTELVVSFRKIEKVSENTLHPEQEELKKDKVVSSSLSNSGLEKPFQKQNPQSAILPKKIENNVNHNFQRNRTGNRG